MLLKSIFIVGLLVIVVVVTMVELLKVVNFVLLGILVRNISLHLSQYQVEVLGAPERPTQRK